MKGLGMIVNSVITNQYTKKILKNILKLNMTALIGMLAKNVTTSHHDKILLKNTLKQNISIFHDRGNKRSE